MSESYLITIKEEKKKKIKKFFEEDKPTELNINTYEEFSILILNRDKHFFHLKYQVEFLF